MDAMQVKDAILKAVGAGRMSLEEAHRELQTSNLEVTEGFNRSLLAFRASALLEENGFTRTGQPQHT
jgi:hypothetical protein